MGWFYTKHITLLKQSGYMYHGSWVDDGYKECKQIECDIQPSNRELIYKEYGYYIDCSKRVFCDKCELKEGDYIKYKNNIYKIVKLIEWEDYFDIFIQEQE